MLQSRRFSSLEKERVQGDWLANVQHLGILQLEAIGAVDCPPASGQGLVMQFEPLILHQVQANAEQTR